MKSSFRLAVIVVALALIAAPVSADTKIARDPDDTAGRLDLKSLSHRHSGTDLVHRLNTYHNWRSRRLRGRRTLIQLWFSTDKEDRYAEKRVVIDFEDGRLRAWLQTYQESSDQVTVGPLRRIEVNRHNRHSVTVLFKKRALVSNRKDRYAWSASTSFKKVHGNGACRHRVCVDSGPPGRGAGRITHKP
jgi:hypothetical protein